MGDEQCCDEMEEPPESDVRPPMSKKSSSALSESLVALGDPCALSLSSTDFTSELTVDRRLDVLEINNKEDSRETDRSRLCPATVSL